MARSRLSDDLLETVFCEAANKGVPIRRLEELVGTYPGYFRRVRSRPEAGVKLDLLEKAGEALGIGRKGVFVRALDLAESKQECLRQIEGDRWRDDKALLRLERAAKSLDDVATKPPHPLTADGAASTSVDELLSRIEQVQPGQVPRRLRESRRYRRADFVAAFLDLLDIRRLDDPERSCRLAVVVSEHLLPKVSARPARLLDLLGTAFGVFASIRRSQGALAPAARALRQALGFAGLGEVGEPVRAHLLRRAGFVARDTGRRSSAIEFFSEAQLIYLKRNDPTGLGRALIEEAAVHNLTPSPRTALRLFNRGLELPLDRAFEAEKRYRMAALNGKAVALRHLGEIEESRSCLEKAHRLLGGSSNLFATILRWQSAALDLEEGRFEEAEEKLLQVGSVLARIAPNKLAMASLDLARAYLAQGKTPELQRLAGDMGRVLGHLQGNRFLQSLIVKFAREGLSGRISRRFLDRMQQKLEEGARRQRSAPGAASAARLDLRAEADLMPG